MCLIHGPDIPGSYAILLFTASDLASITSHIHSWVLFLLWLHPFLLSGVISPLISSSILGTYWPGEFLFPYPIILPFHTVHEVLKARNDKHTEIYSQKTSQSNHTRTTALSNSMKLSHARGATQDRQVMVERSDRMWSTGEGNGKPRQYSCLENPMNSMKRQNDWILK